MLLPIMKLLVGVTCSNGASSLLHRAVIEGQDHSLWLRHLARGH